MGSRAVSLALSRPRIVLPDANYPPRRPDGILVLQRGENASTDYYLRPRLNSAAAPAEIADLSDDPGASRMMACDGPGALLVLVCRYAAPAWLQALEAARGRLARVVFFMDDDLPAMVRARGIPAAARGKVALHFAAHVRRLTGLCSEVWVSTEALAERYPEARPRVLTPLPEAEPPAPDPAPPPLVVYHGTDVHPRERAFVLEVARLVLASRPEARFEITGDAALARRSAGLDNVAIVPQLTWPAYLAAQTGRRAALSLAPLYPSEINDARAPVKAFDAARLGAAGLFADAPAYRHDIRPGEDGLLLPMEPAVWAAAICDLLTHGDRRLKLAEAARGRLIGRLREDPGFPPAPAA